MAIHQEQTRQMGAGMAKRIDPGAIGLVLDNLQRYQYQKPIQSTTRELLSNAVDSIKEKHMAREILSGRASVEDYFVKREEVAGDSDASLYKDSSFDPSYYNLKYLSGTDTIELRYIVGNNVERDRVVFIDTGVGLGGKRLEGYFSMGFSTKRLSKMPLGKWGIGAKSPLSVGVQFYTVESRYNGMLFRFNVYSHSFDSIVPRFNLDTGIENPSYVMYEGTEDEFTIYYEKTELSNMLVITIDNVKKSHRNQYIDAVKSQMLYFDGISLVIEENDIEQTMDYKAKVFYEDDYIILSDNSYYTKPHLLLNKINYGYIDWGELELEDRVGNVGIKVAPEEVEVSPSRENVIWSDKTKEMVNKRFTTVKEIATRIIQDELKGADILRWMRLCSSMRNRLAETHPVVSRLANLIDVNDINLKFEDDPRISFKTFSTISGGLYIRTVTLEKELKVGKNRNVVKRKEHKSLTSLVEMPIILMGNGQEVSNRKDKYILSSMYPNGFVMVYEPFFSGDASKMGVSDEALSRITSLRAKLDEDDIKPFEFFNLLKESKDVTFYDDITVPDQFKGTESEEEEHEATTEEEIAEQKVEQLTNEERRKANGTILIHTPRMNSSLVQKEGQSMMFTMMKMELKISDINTWDEEEIYYGGDSDEEMLHLAAAITRDPHPENKMGFCIRSHAANWSKWMELKYYRLNEAYLKNNYIDKWSAYAAQHFFDNKSIKLIKVAKGNNKYVRDFQHIQRFFLTLRNNTITMSNNLIRWNTARIIADYLPRLKYFNNFPFNMVLSGYYEEVAEYHAKYHRVLYEGYAMSGDVVKDLIRHLDSVRRLQEFVREKPDQPELIAGMSKELFGNPDIKDGLAVDNEMMDKLRVLLDYTAAAGSMLNHIDVLTTKGARIDAELEFELRSYLEFKDVLQYEVSLPEDSTVVPKSLPVESIVEEENNQLV